MINYKTIQWISGTNSSTNAQIGFDAGDSTHYWSHPWSKTAIIAQLPQVSNCGIPGRFIYRVDGQSIVSFDDIDECLSSPCSEGSTCQNGLGRFACICQHGTEGVLCDRETTSKQKKNKSNNQGLIIGVSVPCILVSIVILILGISLRWIERRILQSNSPYNNTDNTNDVIEGFERHVTVQSANIESDQYVYINDSDISLEHEQIHMKL